MKIKYVVQHPIVVELIGGYRIAVWNQTHTAGVIYIPVLGKEDGIAIMERMFEANPDVLTPTEDQAQYFGFLLRKGERP